MVGIQGISTENLSEYWYIKTLLHIIGCRIWTNVWTRKVLGLYEVLQAFSRATRGQEIEVIVRTF